MDLILLFPIMRRCIPLHSFIIRRGIFDKLAVFGETRAVAGAIPRVLGFVVFESATEVWTSRRGGRQKSDGRFKSIEGKLRMKNRARGIENGGIGIGFPSDKVAENVCGGHGICHTPFVKARCNEHVGRGFPNRFQIYPPSFNMISLGRFYSGYTHIAAHFITH